MGKREKEGPGIMERILSPRERERKKGGEEEEGGKSPPNKSGQYEICTSVSL